MKIPKALLSLAGEFAVASELCRRKIYAQPTFGNQKKTDLLSFYGDKMSRFEVKSKQGSDHPYVKGIHGKNVYLIFVDFQDKKDKRPDFYILTSEDWLELVKRLISERIASGKIAKGDVIIDKDNCPIYVKELSKSTGKPFKGIGIKTEYLEPYKERWDKVTEVSRWQKK